ncbi:flagellar hook-length control protein FliK [Rosistilla oblonga]|uniref:Flagellar hook-length control protein n=1 Tax=Rosistilla oblonga TaxID=2527990 RepID=A0A518IPM0_9BACT|nr:flagellar hook-length control protein FliK [Rosistilla oblonga]QDV55034.1 flagellar hook-length control protein [Rosistilla oblonga]
MGDSISLNSINAIRRGNNASLQLQLDPTDLTSGFAQIFEAAPATREQPQPKAEEPAAPKATNKPDSEDRDDDESYDSAAVGQTAATPIAQTSDPLEASVEEPIAAEAGLADPDQQPASATPNGEELDAEANENVAAGTATDSAGENTAATEADLAVDANSSDTAESTPLDTPIENVEATEQPEGFEDSLAETDTTSELVAEPVSDVADPQAGQVAAVAPVSEADPNVEPEDPAVAKAAAEELEPAIARSDVEPGSQKSKRRFSKDAGEERIVGLPNGTQPPADSVQPASTQRPAEGTSPAIVAPAELAVAEELPVDLASVDPTAALSQPEPQAEPASQSTATSIPIAAAKQTEAAARSGATPLPDAAPTIGSAKIETAGNATTAAAAKAKSTETNPLDQVDRAKLLQRVSRAFQQLGTDGGSLKIRLHPPRLGSVGIDVNVSGRKINARIVTESEAASHALRENLHDLKNRLAEQGFQIESIEIGMESEMGTSQGGQQEQRETFQNFAAPPRPAMPEPIGSSELSREIGSSAGSSTEQLDLVA